MQYEIRVLSLGGVLDQSIRLFKDHFKHVISLVALIAFVPLAGKRPSSC